MSCEDLAEHASHLLGLAQSGEAEFAARAANARLTAEADAPMARAGMANSLAVAGLTLNDLPAAELAATCELTATATRSSGCTSSLCRTWSIRTLSAPPIRTARGPRSPAVHQQVGGVRTGAAADREATDLDRAFAQHERQRARAQALQVRGDPLGPRAQQIKQHHGGLGISAAAGRGQPNQGTEDLVGSAWLTRRGPVL